MGLLDALARYSKRRSRRNLYPWLRAKLGEHHVARAAKVLNIGSGGEIGDEVARAGVRATSVDIDPARRPDHLGSVEDLKGVGEETIDVVLCLEVLEHVARPEAAAAAIRRVLKPGGLLIGSTPFLLGIHDAPHDYYRYTAHGLRRLFRDFEPLELDERNGYFSSAAVLLTRRFAAGSLAERKRAALLSPLLVPLSMALEGLDRIFPSKDGTTGYVFVFRKPGG